MSIKKFLVAGFAVVGMVGMVSAQLPLTNVLTNPPNGTMTVSYSVAMEATMSVVPQPLSGEALLAGNVISNPPGGNLGSIVVKTNYPHWDVTTYAQNQLELMSGGTPPSGGWGGGGGTAGTALKIKKGSTPAAVAVLTVGIGIVNAGGSNFEPNTYADFTTALQSATGASQASFADIIGKKLATGKYNNQQGSDDPTTPIAGDIAYDGFDTPAGDNSVTFFVNVSLGDPTTDKVQGNAEGDYQETLHFTLVAAY